MVINPKDDVEVREDGHKYALRDIATGENVLKYGMPIGHATRNIVRGEHVHVHNLATNLSGALEYEYHPCAAALAPRKEFAGEMPVFQGYRRPDGRAGVRNDIWIVPTVGCVDSLCERLAAECGGVALSHPYGCSQLGEDHETTARVLAALCRHPNAGGVLVVGLGCENNTLESFRERLGDISALNIRFMRAQDPGDETERGLALVRELEEEVRSFKREPVPVSALTVGLKCGGSDGFSGLTANPLAGRFSDWLVERGGAAVLTETPEMFGAETLLMDRCRDRETFDRCVRMVNWFKEYYAAHGQPCYENPSPGNKAGGISTLEDKSLGCTQKGGSSAVEDVIEYGGMVRRRGLTLLSAPGNDLVSSTALAAAGCQIVLFTTGRGTPFGTVVPTVKIATNTKLAAAKPAWIDWDAMAYADTEAFAAKIVSVASGELTANERNGARQIAIFKNGVTL